jgi:hypothetical protein
MSGGNERYKCEYPNIFEAPIYTNEYIKDNLIIYKLCKKLYENFNKLYKKNNVVYLQGRSKGKLKNSRKRALITVNGLGYGLHCLKK